MTGLVICQYVRFPVNYRSLSAGVTDDQRLFLIYNISVANQPIITLRRLLTNVNDKDRPEDRKGAVYKIKCYDFQAIYFADCDLQKPLPGK